MLKCTGFFFPAPYYVQVFRQLNLVWRCVYAVTAKVSRLRLVIMVSLRRSSCSYNSFRTASGLYYISGISSCPPQKNQDEALTSPSYESHGQQSDAADRSSLRYIPQTSPHN